MTDSPFEDAVVIDTNVFLHLLNPQNNIEAHINSLLVHLQEKRVALLIDDNSRILGEYLHHIGRMIQSADDVQNEIYILRYWMLNAPRLCSAVNGSDELMGTIKSVILETDATVDHILVYVALSQGKTLVSNDLVHIVCGPLGERNQSSRRRRLLKKSKRNRPKGGEILTSQEACARI